MKQIDLADIINGRFKNFMSSYPGFIKNLSLLGLNKLMHINEINSVLKKFNDKYGIDFIDEIFEHLDFSYNVTHKHKLKIPAEGRVICVANHPLGGLDGLTLLKVISEVRKDVRIVANDVLLNIENLSEMFLPFDIFSPTNQIRQIKDIEKALMNEEAVIMFPAAEVSRANPIGIVDGLWMNGPVKLAKKFNVPILPVHVKAKNSMLFYLISFLNRKLSILFLTREIFNKRSKIINLKIGDPIPAFVFSGNYLQNNEISKLLKKHVYKIGKGKSGVFKTEKNIIHPVNVKSIRRELFKSKLLGETHDNKKIFLVNYHEAPNSMKEISRLRELTFRKVGEGTGHKSDLDNYDKYYKHIVLWDDENLDIAGSYRLGIGQEIIENYGMDKFYNAERFLFSSEFKNLASQGMELGRSFIQQKYWKSSALDYLWQGIGAFLTEYPDIKYLFGAVSISNSYSDYAKDLIVYYYKKWYNFGSNLSISKNRYIISNKKEKELATIFNSNDPESDLKILKQTLNHIGFSVPVLYRKYTDICDFGGVEFLDFGIDKDFSDSIDGFILVDLTLIKSEKKLRYYKNKELVTSN